MICNVCGEDKRCYQLLEQDLSRPGPPLRGLGMIFAICSDCLSKLIEKIKTGKTALDDPAVVQPAANMREVRDRLDARNRKQP